MKEILTALFLTIPLVIAGTIHMVVVRKNWFPSLRRPVNEKLFGPNKTWRGFVVMPVATVLGVLIALAIEPFVSGGLSLSLRSLHGTGAVFLGVALGLGYVLAELPNSFIKRRQGISPGMLPDQNRLLFGFVDQADSAVGCTIAYLLFVPLSFVTGVALILIGPMIHLGANVGLYFMGLRSRPV